MSSNGDGTMPAPAYPGPLEPPVNRGMTTLDSFNRDAFQVDLPVLAAKVRAKNVGRIRKELAGSTLAIPKIASVVHDPSDQSTRLLLLARSPLEELPAELAEIIERNALQTTSHSVRLGYDYWTAPQILRAVLPEHLLDDAPTSFTSVGHIAHFNLREDYLPYKHLIGQIVLDKNPTIETVVNKVDTIDNEFRFFQMEVMAGKEDNYVVEISETGCKFRFDFSKVYWNSRLQGEHLRLVELFTSSPTYRSTSDSLGFSAKMTDSAQTRGSLSSKDANGQISSVNAGKTSSVSSSRSSVDVVVCDGFAGVGPFAMPAAKRGCLGVLANDLNPASAEALRDNARRNRVDDIVRCANMDGGEFFRKAVVDCYENPFKPRRKARSRTSKRRVDGGTTGEAEVTKSTTQQSPAMHASTAALHEPLNGLSISQDAQQSSLSSAPAGSRASNGVSEDAGNPAVGKFIDHFVLNLPATAIDFLDSFQGIYDPLIEVSRPATASRSRAERHSSPTEDVFLRDLVDYSEARGCRGNEIPLLPMVHCYCFTKEVDAPEADIQNRASQALGYPVSSETLKDYSATLVRSVAPKKDMYRLSFRLPLQVVFSKDRLAYVQEYLRRHHQQMQ